MIDCDLQDFIGDLANAVLNCPDEEFVVEALGILGNLTIPDIEFRQLLVDYGMLNYIKSKLQPGNKLLLVTIDPQHNMATSK